MDSKEKMVFEILKIIANRTSKEFGDFKFTYYHYTSLINVYNVLEGDTFWGSNVRFSNDDTELQQFNALKYMDDYVICFCGSGDQLSQWRGYCHDGGASLKLNIGRMEKYSVLHADYDESGKYELIETRPLPVVYINENSKSLVEREKINKIIKKNDKYASLTPENILPYLKNSLFYEEKESRLVFQNEDGRFSKCIRFRTLTNGTKVPYIVFKYGDIGKQKTKCKTNPKVYDDDKIKEIIENRETIYIDAGFDQEQVFNEIFERLCGYQERVKNITKVSIACEGHLPIENITISPMPEAKRQAEQMKRFCRSKYWLRNVDVSVSKIPLV
jgi:hypothetical protein